MLKELILNYGYEELKCYDVKQEQKKKAQNQTVIHERCWRIGTVFVVSGFLNYFNYFMFYLIVYFFLILNYSCYFYFDP